MAFKTKRLRNRAIYGMSFLNIYFQFAPKVVNTISPTGTPTQSDTQTHTHTRIDTHIHTHKGKRPSTYKVTGKHIQAENRPFSLAHTSPRSQHTNRRDLLYAYVVEIFLIRSFISFLGLWSDMYDLILYIYLSILHIGVILNGMLRNMIIIYHIPFKSRLR